MPSFAHCPNCGNLIINPPQKCSSCGDEVSATPAAITPSQPPSRSQEKQEQEKNAPPAAPTDAAKPLSQYKKPVIVDVCIITAMMIFMLSLVGGVMLGSEMGSFIVTLYVAISSFLFCMLIFVVGEIINQLAIANYNTNSLKQQNEKIISLLTNDSQNS